jgi:hypothetical protein
MTIKQTALLIAGLISTLAWNTAPHLPDDDALTIHVRRCISYDGEDMTHWKAGIIWSFSYIGATWPKGSFTRAVQPVSPLIYQFNFKEMGLPAAAQLPLAQLLDSLKKSDEYQQRCAIDLGRLLMLTVHSSWHYYRLAGAEPRLANVLKAFDTNETLQFPAIYSSVAKGNRILYLQRQPGPLFTYLAEEGDGRYQLGNFQATEFETFSLMPNGQFRYAIYDQAGNLEAATPQHLAGAGKPTKCQWCHESKVLPLFKQTYSIAGFATPREFNDEIARHQTVINAYREQLSTEINYKQGNEEHAFAEILYVSFMEPSIKRIAAEWGWTEPEVRQYLKGLPTHKHPEFPQLGTLYHRHDVDKMAPYPTLKVPDSAREMGEEPNFWESSSY